MGSRKQSFFLGAAILFIFVAWNVCKAAQLEPSLLGYEAKFSIFFRNYQAYGIWANRLFPAYNLRLTNPPSQAYLSESPFLSLIMYIAANVFGDQPTTYRSVILIINVFFFVLLAFFVGRRWGMRPALWTLFFVALSPYAFHYGYEQAFEQLCVLGMFSSIFLYFEWFQKRKNILLVLSLIAYFIGFAASYLAFFSALTICVHYLLFEKKRSWINFLKMSGFPLVTLGYVLCMSVLIKTAGLSVYGWFERALIRSTGTSRYELLSALFFYPVQWIGPVLMIAAVAYFLFRHQQNGKESPSLDLILLYSFLIPGLLTTIVFRNLYVNHPYIIVFFLPFFIVLGALAVDHLLQIYKGKWSKCFITCVFVFGFLASSLFLPEMSRLLNPQSSNVEERVANLANAIKKDLTPQNRLLVLGGDDSIALTAFYVLWIPTFELKGTKDLNEELKKRKDVLVLCGNGQIINLFEKFNGVTLLARDQSVAFFRVRD